MADKTVLLKDDARQPAAKEAIFAWMMAWRSRYPDAEALAHGAAEHFYSLERHDDEIADILSYAKAVFNGGPDIMGFSTVQNEVEAELKLRTNNGKPTQVNSVSPKGQGWDKGKAPKGKKKAAGDGLRKDAEREREVELEGDQYHKIWDWMESHAGRYETATALVDAAVAHFFEDFQGQKYDKHLFRMANSVLEDAQENNKASDDELGKREIETIPCRACKNGKVILADPIANDCPNCGAEYNKAGQMLNPGGPRKEADDYRNENGERDAPARPGPRGRVFDRKAAPAPVRKSDPAGDDPDYEEEEVFPHIGDYVDYGAYGKLYYCGSNRVTDLKEDRANPNAQGWNANHLHAIRIIEHYSDVEHEEGDGEEDVPDDDEEGYWSDDDPANPKNLKRKYGDDVFRRGKAATADLRKSVEDSLRRSLRAGHDKRQAVLVALEKHAKHIPDGQEVTMAEQVTGWAEEMAADVLAKVRGVNDFERGDIVVHSKYGKGKVARFNRRDMSANVQWSDPKWKAGENAQNFIPARSLKLWKPPDGYETTNEIQEKQQDDRSERANRNAPDNPYGKAAPARLRKSEEANKFKAWFNEHEPYDQTETPEGVIREYQKDTKHLLSAEQRERYLAYAKSMLDAEEAENEREVRRHEGKAAPARLRKEDGEEETWEDRYWRRHGPKPSDSFIARQTVGLDDDDDGGSGYDSTRQGMIDVLLMMKEDGEEITPKTLAEAHSEHSGQPVEEEDLRVAESVVAEYGNMSLDELNNTGDKEEPVDLDANDAELARIAEREKRGYDAEGRVKAAPARLRKKTYADEAGDSYEMGDGSGIKLPKGASKCWSCKGTGEKDGESCERCEGKGYRPERTVGQLMDRDAKEWDRQNTGPRDGRRNPYRNDKNSAATASLRKAYRPDAFYVVNLKGKKIVVPGHKMQGYEDQGEGFGEGPFRTRAGADDYAAMPTTGLTDQKEFERGAVARRLKSKAGNDENKSAPGGWDPNLFRDSADAKILPDVNKAVELALAPQQEIISKQAAALEEMSKRLEELEAQPMPGGPGLRPAKPISASGSPAARPALEKQIQAIEEEVMRYVGPANTEPNIALRMEYIQKERDARDKLQKLKKDNGLS